MRPDAPPPAPPDPLADPDRWRPVRLLMRAKDVLALRRWAAEEDRPVELHMARLLRLAALEHAERRGATDAR